MTALRCLMPWASLAMDELGGDPTLLPCCATWTRARWGAPADGLLAAWTGTAAAQMRDDLANNHFGSWCDPSCPLLGRGDHGEDSLRALDGPPAFAANLAALREDIAERRAHPRARPIFLKLLPTLRCNLRCRMCWQGHDGGELLADRAWAEIDSLIPTLAEICAQGGEALLSPRFRKLIYGGHCERHPALRFSLITNGTLLGPRFFGELPRLRLGYVTVSLNAATSKTWTALTGRSGFERAWNATLRLRDSAEAHPLGRFDVIASFVLTRTTSADLPAFLERAAAADLGVQLLPLEGNRGDEEGEVSASLSLLDGLPTGRFAPQIRWLRDTLNTRAGAA